MALLTAYWKRASYISFEKVHLFTHHMFALWMAWPASPRPAAILENFPKRIKDLKKKKCGTAISDVNPRSMCILDPSVLLPRAVCSMKSCHGDRQKLAAIIRWCVYRHCPVPTLRGMVVMCIGRATPSWSSDMYTFLLLLSGSVLCKFEKRSSGWCSDGLLVIYLRNSLPNFLKQLDKSQCKKIKSQSYIDISIVKGAYSW